MTPRAGLDRASVVETAARLIDELGLEHLTLADLARRLGVRTPSLYNHVAGLQDLRDELAILGIREVGRKSAEASMGKTGGEAIEALAYAYRMFIRERPGLYAATFPASPFRETDHPELQSAEAEALGPTLKALACFGLEGDDAVHALRCLNASVHGFATVEVAHGFGIALSIDESFRRMLRMYISGLQQFANDS